MTRNLILSGGVFHPFDESSQALAQILSERGIGSEIVGDVDTAARKIQQGNLDMLTINALRWRMQTSDKYEPYRTEWAYSAPEETRLALADFVRAGGALLALHTASICFDDWPGWGEILGGRWVWGSSHHPPFGNVSVEPSGVSHAITAGIEPFEVTDEVYHDLELQPDVEPLLFAKSANGGSSQPVCWARRHGEGRVVYDALGHDAESLNQPQHRRLVLQAAQWLADSREVD